MQRADYKKYKAALEAKRAELARGLSKRDEIAIEKTADALDEVQFATERELAIRNLDRESGLLRAVRAALARMEEGAYGICIHCEEEIKPRRLEAVPWAAYCVNCQEILDSRRRTEEGGDRIEELVEDTV
jgi:DnaK suppressor protein